MAKFKAREYRPPQSAPLIKSEGKKSTTSIVACPVKEFKF